MWLIKKRDTIYFIANQKRLLAYFSTKFDAIEDRPLYRPQDFLRPLIRAPFEAVHVLVGGTGLGKTQYALAHFRRPLHVKDNEDWRRFGPGHDGIVMDDMDFHAWSPLKFLKLLDMETPVTQNVKYGSVRIPAGMPSRQIPSWQTAGRLGPTTAQGNHQEGPAVDSRKPRRK